MATDLESRIRALEQRASADQVRDEHLTHSIDQLVQQVSTLTEAMDRGRGALWVIGAAGTLVSAIVSFYAHTFLERH